MHSYSFQRLSVGLLREAGVDLAFRKGVGAGLDDMHRATLLSRCLLGLEWMDRESRVKISIPIVHIASRPTPERPSLSLYKLLAVARHGLCTCLECGSILNSVTWLMYQGINTRRRVRCYHWVYMMARAWLCSLFILPRSEGLFLSQKYEIRLDTSLFHVRWTYMRTRRSSIM